MLTPWLAGLFTFCACALIGGIPFGWLIGKIKGLDIRQHGSGNIGATNVLRTCGKPWGITCFVLDAGKGFLPVLVVRRLVEDSQIAGVSALPVVAVIGTVVGHMWTPYLRFRGGKGIATSAGAVLALAPVPVLVAAVVWTLVARVFRYVSLASIAAAVALPVAAIVQGRLGHAGYPPLTVGVLVLLGTLAIARHLGNIKRLLNHTEPKIGQKVQAHEDNHPR